MIQIFCYINNITNIFILVAIYLGYEMFTLIDSNTRNDTDHVSFVLRYPRDDIHQQVKILAIKRNVSVNKMIWQLIQDGVRD